MEIVLALIALIIVVKIDRIVSKMIGVVLLVCSVALVIYGCSPAQSLTGDGTGEITGSYTAYEDGADTAFAATDEPETELPYTETEAAGTDVSDTEAQIPAETTAASDTTASPETTAAPETSKTPETTAKVPETTAAPETTAKPASGSAAKHTHKWKAATCTEPKTCQTCGKTEGEPLWHDWGADWEKGDVCVRCGIVSKGHAPLYTGEETSGTGEKCREGGEHLWYYCDNFGQKVCAKCGDGYCYVMGHTVVQVDKETLACKECGGEKITHVFDEDGVCTVCKGVTANKFCRLVAQRIAEIVNEYRIAEGHAPAVLLPGMSEVAQYRVKQMASGSGIDHDAEDIQEAADHCKYGSVNSEGHYSTYTLEAVGYCGFGVGFDTTKYALGSDKLTGYIENYAREIADMYRSSPAHWAYVGAVDDDYPYIGVGYNGGISCIMVGSVNFG